MSKGKNGRKEGNSSQISPQPAQKRLRCKKKGQARKVNSSEANLLQRGAEKARMDHPAPDGRGERKILPGKKRQRQAQLCPALMRFCLTRESESPCAGK